MDTSLFKVFSPMRIINDPVNKVLYFKYFSGDRRFKKYVRYVESGSGMKYLDAFDDLKKKRIQIAREIYPKLNSNWFGNLNELRAEYIKLLESDDKIYSKSVEI